MPPTHQLSLPMGLGLLEGGCPFLPGCWNKTLRNQESEPELKVGKGKWGTGQREGPDSKLSATSDSKDDFGKVSSAFHIFTV